MFTCVINYINGKIVVTDTTTYTDRSIFANEYQIIYKDGQGNEKLAAIDTYDPLSVLEVNASAGDGRFCIVVTQDGTEIKREDYLVCENLKQCVLDKETEFINATCGSENEDEIFDELNKVKITLAVIERIKLEGKGYDKAQCLLEYAFEFCKSNQNCRCGC